MGKLNKPFQPHSSRYVFFLAGILLTLFLCLPSASVSAHGNVIQAGGNGPQITAVSAGFNSQFRPGTWIPVQISLTNNATSFDGAISITLPSTIDANTGQPAGGATYQQAISLPSLSKKIVTLYVPMPQQVTSSTPQLTIALIDSNGTAVSRNQMQLTSLASNELSIGLLTDSSDPNTQEISRAVKDIASATPQTDVMTSASMFPTRAEALKNFDFLIIDNFSSSNLSADQLTALQGWVHQGGTLVVAGGPEWQHTLGPLPGKKSEKKETLEKKELNP